MMRHTNDHNIAISTHAPDPISFLASEQAAERYSLSAHREPYFAPLTGPRSTSAGL